MEIGPSNLAEEVGGRIRRSQQAHRCVRRRDDGRSAMAAFSVDRRDRPGRQEGRTARAPSIQSSLGGRKGNGGIAGASQGVENPGVRMSCTDPGPLAKLFDERSEIFRQQTSMAFSPSACDHHGIDVRRIGLHGHGGDRVMDGLQVQRVRAKQYEVGLLAERDGSDPVFLAQHARPLDRHPGQSVAGAQPALAAELSAPPGVQIVQRALVTEPQANPERCRRQTRPQTGARIWRRLHGPRTERSRGWERPQREEGAAPLQCISGIRPIAAISTCASPPTEHGSIAARPSADCRLSSCSRRFFARTAIGTSS